MSSGAAAANNGAASVFAASAAARAGSGCPKRYAIACAHSKYRVPGENEWLPAAIWPPWGKWVTVALATWSPNGSETVTFQYIELWTANKMITVASFRTAGARAPRGCRGPLGVKIIRPIELFRVS